MCLLFEKLGCSEKNKLEEELGGKGIGEGRSNCVGRGVYGWGYWVFFWGYVDTCNTWRRGLGEN